MAGLLGPFQAQHFFQLNVFQAIQVALQSLGLLLQILQFFGVGDMAAVQGGLVLFDLDLLGLYLFLGSPQGFVCLTLRASRRFQGCLGRHYGFIVSQDAVNIRQARMSLINLRVDLLQSVELEGAAHARIIGAPAVLRKKHIFWPEMCSRNDWLDPVRALARPVLCFYNKANTCQSLGVPMEKPKAKLLPLAGFREYPAQEMRRRAADFYAEISRRRSVRDFSDRPVEREVIETCLLAAGSAPNGANRQPWHFVVVSSAETKQAIRQAAEEEERRFYTERATAEWLEALAPLGTDWRKPFLETAPYLIAIFAQVNEVTPAGKKRKNYYVQESVGIATGFLIAALHHAGLATLTHTPSPMNFLNQLLNRPSNERPFLLLVVGYPAPDARVPRIGKKPLDEITTFI